MWASSLGKPLDALHIWEHLAIGGVCGVFTSTAICAPEVSIVSLLCTVHNMIVLLVLLASIEAL